MGANQRLMAIWILEIDLYLRKTFR